MKRKIILEIAIATLLALVSAGCGLQMQSKAASDADTGPEKATVEPVANADSFKVDHPEKFSIATAGERLATSELNVTGLVGVDVSRQIPVPSLSSGRVMEVDARLGDNVKKGQLLFRVRSTDIASAISDYRKAKENEQLAIKNEGLTKIQLDRAKTLYDKGAVAKSSLEIAQNADDAANVALDNTRVDVQTATEHLQLLGADPDHTTGVVDVFAPVSGVITDQQVTTSSGVQALTAPNPFTISDMSHVWIICDVYENNMAQVHPGEFADIHLNAYPGHLWKGRISNIAPIVDPNIRTAKVRLEVDNPDGLMRIGMFVTATFHGAANEKHATVPASAILHLHDREWVYVPGDNASFHRVEVVAGAMLNDGLQEVISGIQPGTRVIADALVFQNTAEQ